MSPLGFLTQVTVHQGGHVGVRLLPLRLGDDRLPRFLAEAEVRHVSDHLAQISAGFAIKTVVDNNEIEVHSLA